MPKIHNTAIVDSKAELAESVVVGPYAIISGKVQIGPETKVGPYSLIEGPCKIGSHNHIGSYVNIGGAPQHAGYKGEATEVEIGNVNIFREQVTIHRGTVQGRGKTTIGNFCMLMVGAHIAHDCIIGDAVIMANYVQIAGVVTIHNNAFFGGLSAIHQHGTVGRAVMVGGLTGMAQDPPPFSMVIGERAKFVGLNRVGLKRLGFKEETVEAIKNTYRILHSQEILIEDGLKQVEKEYGSVPEVLEIIQFYRESERGVISR
jgi:UDP-N-acetylglucosamine acyltransferase